MSLLSLPRAGSRSRRLVVCGAAAAVVLLPATAQAETIAPTPVAESSALAATESPVEAPVTDPEAPVAPAVDGSTSVDQGADGSTSVDQGVDGAADGTGVDGAVDGTVDDGTVDDGTVDDGTVDDGTGMTFPEIDPAALSGLFTPICATGTLTGLTLQLDQLSGLLEQLQASGFPIPEEAFAELPSGTVDIPLDDATLGELATELNTVSAELGELGLTDADIDAALAELPANIRDDVETLIGELQAGTVQPATLRGLLAEIFPCPVAPPVVAPVAPVVHEDVTYLGYAPTGGNGSDGGSPLALLGSGAALLAGGGLFAASALRSRAARS